MHNAIVYRRDINLQCTYVVRDRYKYHRGNQVVIMEDKVNSVTPLKSRSNNELFDWKKQFFICGEMCNPKRDKTGTGKGYSRSWSYVENSISADSDSIYSKVITSAMKYQDQAVIDRFSSNILSDAIREAKTLESLLEKAMIVSMIQMKVRKQIKQ